MTRSRRAILAVICAAAVTGSSSALAAPPAVLHLTISALSPATLTPGSTFSERYTEKNVGQRRAAASRASFYLSPSARLGSASTRLGGARIRALTPHHATTGTVRLHIPAQVAPGAYFLIGCTATHSRCRTAQGRLVVATESEPIGAGTGPSGGTTTGPAGSTGPTGGGGGGGSMACAPMSPPTLTSTNPTCFDGDAAHGIFVSGIGDDANPGTMAFPKRTLGAGLTAASIQHKDLYVTKGVYPETLVLAVGVNVYGGYDTSWQRSAANITKVTGPPTASGDIAAAVAVDVTSPTELQLLTLAPVAPLTPGASSYGLQGTDDGGLRLDHVTVVAAPGADGAAGSGGAPGAAGGDGTAGKGSTPGAGGQSAAGHPGGRGGQAGQLGANGFDGSPGQATTPDAWGDMGGPGGSGGVGSSARGAPGYDGDTGKFLGDGVGELMGSACGRFWCGGSGQPGTRGTDGHGGGGGGGGASESCTVNCSENFGGGGGGGGGGQGGGGGLGGQGGGGSFGILLADSSGAVVRDSIVTAADGGAGGAGGPGAFGGIGGGGAFGGAPGKGGDGGTGGDGGEGGRGGDGGGGAGGPSFGIYGLSPADTPGTTVSHGRGGPGGRGGVGAGNGGGAGSSGEEGDYI